MSEFRSDICMTTPLTTEQVGDLQRCFGEWLAIRHENGYDTPVTVSDVMKSCLLGRMTIEGKPPLKNPPPTAYSAPWYFLIENHGVDLSQSDVEGPYQDLPGREGTWYSICQSLWHVVAQGDGGGFAITHDRVDGLWNLRHRNADDPQYRKGTRMVDGKAVPWYADTDDWILTKVYP